MKDNKKKKKEKVKYVDDGRTLYDMSGTSRPNAFIGGKNNPDRNKKRGTARQQFNTYVSTMRQMVLPMFVVMGIITVAFAVMYLLFKYGV